MKQGAAGEQGKRSRHMSLCVAMLLLSTLAVKYLRFSESAFTAMPLRSEQVFVG